MVFSSTVFLFLFIPIVLVLYFNPFIKNRKYKNIVLLLASIGFYGWGEPLFVFVMIGMSLLNWVFGIIIQISVKHKKLFTGFIIICDVLLLGIFKYLTFITKNISILSGGASRVIEVALPIGISFFSFQMISYILDVYRGAVKAQKNPLNVLLYITMFPQLIAGPIVRYETIENEIMYRQEKKEEFVTGMSRFVYGLGKKVLIANYLAMVADAIFAQINNSSVCTAWLGVICYAMQIYFDFSGYSDMAIGLGLIFGFHFHENFNYPYIAKSVTDFWRRWHISLSSWFRDYIYIPLGGNRVSRTRWLRNMMIVWALTGIWHGANWNYLVWGGAFFVLLVIERAIGVAKIERFRVVSHLYTSLVILLSWVIFRAESLSDAVKYLGTMFGIGAKGFFDSDFVLYISNCKWILIIALLFCCPIYQIVIKKIKKTSRIVFDSIAVLIVFILSIMNIVSSSYNPFIYFNF